MKLRKILSTLSAAALAVTALCSSYTLAAKPIEAAADTFTDLDQNSIVAAMGAGWNLGNQLEAGNAGIPSETAWGNPVISKDLIQVVKDSGFNTIRIPISYLNYIGDKASGYKINESWLNRVKEVVDYAYDIGMYVIINMHGDGYTTVTDGWLMSTPETSGRTGVTPVPYTEEEQKEVNNKFGLVWEQIANTFKDYDEHLVFESMNEVFDGSYGNPTKSGYDAINGYNQIFVDTVRKTGSNNAKRWLLIPGWNTNIDQTVGNYGFALPTDTYRDSSISKNRIMVSVHYYDPWDFSGDGTSTRYSQWGKDADPTKRPSYANTESYMEGQIKKVYDKFVSAGYPVIIGEYGCINKSSADPENTKFRAYYDKTLCEFAKQYGCVPVYWDNGAVSNSFGLFNRQTKAVAMPEIVEAIVSVFSSAKENLQRVVDTTSELVEGNYTPASWADLDTALTKAQNLLKNGGSDSEYTAAYDALLNAYLSLELSENYSEEIVVISENDKVNSSSNETETDLYLKSIDPSLTDVSKISKLTIKFTVNGDISDSDNVFILKPYDNENWSGWDDNFVKIADCTYDAATGVYTAEVDAQAVLASYSGTRAAGANGINLYYASNDPDIQLIYYSATITEGHIHTYVEVERVEPTETEDGYIRYVCSECDDTYDKILPATGSAPANTVTVSGTLTIPGGDTTDAIAVIGNEEDYELVEVIDGKYSVTITKGDCLAVFVATDCAPRAYEFNAQGDVTLDAELHLYGDINGDGKITTADVGLANADAKGIKALEDYDFDVADVNLDAKISTADVGIINLSAKAIA